MAWIWLSSVYFLRRRGYTGIILFSSWRESPV